MQLFCFVYFYVSLSYDVASASDITPCNKIDKPLVVTTSGLQIFGKRYDVHNNVAYIKAKI